MAHTDCDYDRIFNQIRLHPWIPEHAKLISRHLGYYVGTDICESIHASYIAKELKYKETHPEYEPWIKQPKTVKLAKPDIEQLKAHARFEHDKDVATAEKEADEKEDRKNNKTVEEAVLPVEEVEEPVEKPKKKRKKRTSSPTK